jgi:hypothetical protein
VERILEQRKSELTLSYLKNVSGGKIIYDYDSILSKLEIELEELYDSYSFYYNQTPNEKDYDKKDLDYGLDIFLKGNSEIIENVFSDLSDQLIELKEIENLLDNKRDLTKKYVSTDFYYLSTGSNVQDFLSGKLFDCDNAVLNFLNREFPTTASTPQTSYLKSPRYSGFFTPSKLGVVLVDGSNSSYSINLSNLTPNTVYYFPDPNVCGENGGVLSFTVDESFLKKNYSSGNAVNKPRSSSNDTKYNGYVSKIDQNKSKYLENIFDYGYISDLKYDIYGNLFGLFKNPGKFVKTVEYKDSQITYNVLLNGYTFFDHLYNEGFSFNYLPESTYDETTYRETIRTGLSTNTSTILGRGDVEITFFGGFFTPYDELIEPTESTTIYQIYDNAYILNGYGNPLTDTVSSDLSSFENGYGSHYYTTLLEGGIADDSPLQRALLDNTTPYIESLSATFVNYPKLSNINSIDGGYNINYDFDIYLTPRSYILLPETITPTKILEFNDLSSQSLTGQLMVKNHKTKSCDTLTNSFTYFETKYPYDVFDQLNGRIVNFEIVNDILLIETPNYFTIDKITVGEQGIMDSKTETIILNHSNGNFDKLSNRYKIDNHVYYCKLTTSTDAISSNDFIIYPEIWEFDIINFKNKKIFPPTAYDTSNFFSVSGGNIRAYDCD